MKKLLFDTVVWNKLRDDVKTHGILKEKIKEGKIKILSTHIEDDEISNIKNFELKRKTISKKIEILNEVTPTMGFVLGKSRLGVARLGNGNKLKLDEVTKGNKKHINDALIASTSAEEEAILITNDQTLTKRSKNKCSVLDYEEFKTFLSEL